MFWIVSICWLHIIRSNVLVFCETQYFAFCTNTLYRSPQGLKVAESWHCRFGLINGNFWVNQCSLELSSILCQAVVKTAVCVRFLSLISKSKQFWTPFIFCSYLLYFVVTFSQNYSSSFSFERSDIQKGSVALWWRSGLGTQMLQVWSLPGLIHELSSCLSNVGIIGRFYMVKSRKSI